MVSRFSLFVMLVFPFLNAQAQIERFDHVDTGVYRGSQPENSADYAFLKNVGIHTILNLRTHDDEIQADQVAAEKEGMGFRNIPLNSFFSPSEEDMKKAIEILTDPTLQPVYVHCQHGKDRTGLVIGMYRVEIQHWPREKAWEEMKSWGFNSLLIGLNTYFWDHTKDDWTDLASAPTLDDDYELFK